MFTTLPAAYPLHRTVTAWPSCRPVSGVTVACRWPNASLGTGRVARDPGVQAVCTIESEERPSAATACNAPCSCFKKALKKAVVDLMTGPDVGPTTPEAAM
jgi:hypothetical protein